MSRLRIRGTKHCWCCAQLSTRPSPASIHYVTLRSLLLYLLNQACRFHRLMIKLKIHLKPRPKNMKERDHMANLFKVAGMRAGASDVRIPAGDKIFCVLQNFHTGSAAHAASSSMGAWRAPFRCGKAAVV